jgi:adenylosuccinate synthase
MPLTVIVGGQYGSEGKGKVTSYLAVRDDVDIVVRCGGPNSGHTVDVAGQRYELRSLPAGFINQRSRLLLAAGSLINPEILLTEIKVAGIDPRRVGVDRHAGIISASDGEEEGKLFLRDRFGSTLSGTGIAVANRVLRSPGFKLAKDVPELHNFLTDVSAEVNDALDKDGRVIVEGTQGFGLSVYHSPHYPYATSRDTTASGFLSEVGVSPRLVTDIVMAVRTYPIRVAGNSGPFTDEITWEEVRQRSGYPNDIRELTTTTKKVRRVGLFDLGLVQKAVVVNRPTQIALHGADYLSYLNKGLRNYGEIESVAKSFVERIEISLKIPVSTIGTGPANEELIDRTGLSQADLLRVLGS